MNSLAQTFLWLGKTKQLSRAAPGQTRVQHPWILSGLLPTLREEDPSANVKQSIVLFIYYSNRISLLTLLLLTFIIQSLVNTQT